MSITYPPEMLPTADEAADVWVKCPCGCTWDPSMLAACPVCDEPKNLGDVITRLTQDLKEARDRLDELVKAAEPILRLYEREKLSKEWDADIILTVAAAHTNHLVHMTRGDLRVLFEAVARAKKEGK